MVGQRISDRVFTGTAFAMFASCSTITVLWCRSMSAMGSMHMAGGWTMSMAWMRMPGQSWLGAAGSFTGMWVVMMAAMMLPSLVPMMNRYRDSFKLKRSVEGRVNLLTAVAGTGYLLIWAGWGIAIFPFGAALAELEMNSTALARAAPVASAAAVLVAGAIQLSRWKLRFLEGCRRTAPTTPYDDPIGALRHGLRLGTDCSLSCANLTAVLLVFGVMDARVMAIITAAITAERLAKNGESAARGTGVGIIATGLVLALRAAAQF